MPFMEFVRSLRRDRSGSVFIILVFCGIVSVVALCILAYSAAYLTKPGPSVYYSRFASLYLSSCLLFEAFQCFLFASERTTAFSSAWRKYFTWIYWAVLTISGFICGIAYATVPKSDTAAVEFFGGFVGACAIYLLVIRRHGLSSSSVTENLINDEARPKRQQGFLVKVAKVLNRFLKTIHCCFAVLFMAGAITLSLQYRFSNPGTEIQLKLASGQSRSLSYYCTSVASSQTLPTFWFEGSAAHGVVDFLGAQHYLATIHGRNSCSYDPPGFGWSEPLPANLVDWYGYFTPLLKALHQEEVPRIVVGWGGGVENALRHAVEAPNETVGLVLLDAAPDGIEWLDAQRANNWTTAQMLDYRQTDLHQRASLAQTILAIGIPWGLMPVFLPGNASNYFDAATYPRYHAQSLKEDMWALQYYSIRYSASQNISSYLVDTVVPAPVKTFAILTEHSQSEKASDDFYREQKVRMANHIAGGNGSALFWCTDADCSLSFPVEKAEWTAKVLASLQI